MTANGKPMILDFLGEIYQPQDTESLANVIIQRLPALIPGDNVMVARHDGVRRALTGLALRQPFSRGGFLTEAGLMAFHPFWDRLFGAGQPLKILSEMAPGRSWLENPLYLGALREDRFRDQLGVEFGVSPSCYTSVSVIRSTVGFGESDRETMRLLLPHLEQAFSNARIVEQAGISARKDGSDSTAIAHSGAWLEPSARGRLRAMLGNTETSLARLDRWFATTLDLLNRGACATPELRIRHGSRISVFQLRRDWLRDRYLLLHRLAVGSGALLAQPLSQKEREILFWIAEGKSNPEIATLLAISPETVKTHLKRIFRKLGVDNRTAAANHFK